MELQKEQPNYTSIYSGNKLTKEELGKLIDILSDRHAHSENNQDSPEAERWRLEKYMNIFDYPLRSDNGINLDEVTSGLSQIASEFKADEKYKKQVRAIGRRFLMDGRCRLHGEYEPKHWIKTEAGPVVSPPKISPYGAPEYDWGVLIAHLIISGHSYSYIDTALTRYKKGEEWDQILAWNYCGVEIMRRIMGKDQLPLEISLHRRHELLELSYELICRREW